MVQSQACRSPVRMPPSQRATTETMRSSRSTDSHARNCAVSSSVKIARSFFTSRIGGTFTRATGFDSMISSRQASPNMRFMAARTWTTVCRFFFASTTATRMLRTCSGLTSQSGSDPMAGSM